ncbi:MAG: hypothetical protein Q9186_005535 [Xanthomendoza sp. 1 TL-2023]
MLSILLLYPLICELTVQVTARKVTAVHLLSVPSLIVSTADNTEYYCTTSSNWLTNTWDPDDCAGAVQKVLDTELLPKRNNVYEFYENGTRQSLPRYYYGQETPRKYVFRKLSGRQLNNLSWAGENLGIARCAAYCDSFDYFGVENGEEHFLPFAAFGGESACNITCNGNDTEMCGGASALNVYQHARGEPFIPPWGGNSA